MASLPDLIAQLMQQMIVLQREIISLQRDRTPNMIQISNKKKTDHPDIEPNATNNDWALFLDTWTWYKEMYQLTEPVKICNKLRMICPPEVNRLFLDLIEAEILNSASKGWLLLHITVKGLQKEIY